ncbi:MAG: hypothetical protein PHF70_00730 [Opitutales bacterium]|nr:hypothetical protein [Opitutales bacterium]
MSVLRMPVGWMSAVVGVSCGCAAWGAAPLWQDDFDDGIPLNQKYEDTEASGMSQSAVASLTGTHSLQQQYSVGQVGAGWVIKLVDHLGKDGPVFMRYYHLFEDGFQGFPPKMARIRYRNRSTWTSPLGIHIWLETSGSNAGKVCLDIKASDSSQANSLGWLPLAVSPFSYADVSNIGRWVCFELEVKLNTPGQADGWFNLWIDNRLAVGRLNVDFRGSQTYGLNECMLDCYWNGGSPKAQSRFYDAFVVSLERIGMIPPPNAAPVLAPIGSRSAPAGERLQFTVEATDADGNELQYSATGEQ